MVTDIVVWAPFVVAGLWLARRVMVRWSRAPVGCRVCGSVSVERLGMCSPCAHELRPIRRTGGGWQW
jgi:hypothetical protein